MPSRRILLVLAALVAAPLSARPAQAQPASPIRNVPEFGSTVTPANDDFNFDFTLPFTITWDGLTSSALSINNNGYVYFGSGGPITPCSGSAPGGFSNTCGLRAFVAYNRDLDSREGSTSPMTYGVGTVDGRQAFGANYFNFGYYNRGPAVMDFQLLLIDRSDVAAGDFDVEYNYGRMAASGGGRGGWVASASSGAIAGSGTDTFTDQIAYTRQGFTVRNGVASGVTSLDLTVTAAPEPGTWALLGTGLVAMGGAVRVRRRAA